MRSLENRIAFLEQKLRNSDPEEATDHLTPRVVSLSPTETASERPNNRRDDLSIGVGFVELTGSSESYFGTSSGFPLAESVQAALSHYMLCPRSSNDTPSAPERSAVSMPATMPSAMLSEKLVEAYLAKVHPKHPFMRRSEISDLTQRRHELAARCRRKENNSSRTQPSREDRFSFFKLHMLYAIGCRYRELSGSFGDSSHESHYLSAMQHIDVVFQVKCLESLEALLLLAIYQLRSPSLPGIWSLIGASMRLCLELGLHRRSKCQSPLQDQRRKRLFWVTYMLERSVAFALGRPLSVSDRDIDIDLPANVDDDIEHDETLAYAIEHSYAFTSMAPFIHIVRIVRIESHIQQSIYRVDRPSREFPEIDQFLEQLLIWKDDIPVREENADKSHPYVSLDYHMIQYYKSILFLLLPQLSSYDPLGVLFKDCVIAAGQICQLYKKLHSKQEYISFSILALQASFVAGLTLLYCYSVSKQLFDQNFSSDIRACSAVLFVIAERWPAACKFRDAFDALVHTVVEGGSLTNFAPPAMPSANNLNAESDDIFEMFNYVTGGDGERRSESLFSFLGGIPGIDEL